MIYNLYQTLFDQSEVLIKVDNQLNNILKQKLFFIEEEIAKEFLSKQKGRIGIKSLGNEIRYNKLVKNILKKTTQNFQTHNQSNRKLHTCLFWKGTFFLNH